jgi:hypothetical protein
MSKNADSSHHFTAACHHLSVQEETLGIKVLTLGSVQ